MSSVSSTRDRTPSNSCRGPNSGAFFVPGRNQKYPLVSTIGDRAFHQPEQLDLALDYLRQKANIVATYIAFSSLPARCSSYRRRALPISPFKSSWCCNLKRLVTTNCRLLELLARQHELPPINVISVKDRLASDGRHEIEGVDRRDDEDDAVLREVRAGFSVN